ncbi:hypothetical protein [Mycobacterium lepromatosis]|nr:hypothetical protein [Mycobacterium lepromatosis]
MSGVERGEEITPARVDSTNSWYSLWTMVTGFVMIVLDSNIVAIA